ncbi:PucR family transcriptional regulator [Paenibacillus rhizoplanae]
MLLTLETFFEMDCNVSETAKKLYIHRNTLLYRLDKIKQETGADVRSFGDAAIVKLAMLLYKVTKKKIGFFVNLANSHRARSGVR